MSAALTRVLVWAVAAIVALDTLWAAVGHFTIDFSGYMPLFLFALWGTAAAVYYNRVRNEAELSAVFSATVFLTIFPTACCVLCYLALSTVGHHRIDAQLAAFDRAMGVNWPAVMGYAANHPFLTRTLMFAYDSLIPQTVLLILLLGWTRHLDALYGLCFAMSVGLVVTIAFWAAFPSFGAFSFYHLPAAINAKLALMEDAAEAHRLLSLFAARPHVILVVDLHGLIGFPSFHTAEALLLAWYAGRLAYLRWPALLLNAAVIASTIVQGGHHAVDVIGGLVVGAIAIAAASGLVRRIADRESEAEFRMRPQPAAALAQ